MVCFTQPDPWVFQKPRDLNPLQLTHPGSQPGRERLRHLVMGSPQGVRATINSLHALQYADQGTWSRLIDIPPSGIVITPEQGEVFSYLVRHWPLS
ncbi:MAG: hypothetical protein ACFCVD_22340 [Nodosilinea sp.]